ncbi:hypothetical protein [Microbacterium kunmingense]|uniref:hypothetical protein n=1 Tax=Microbacterium kunmingense TaxID=2915939 RepID=UPI002006101E|nr:hypothetical protein [Microbacterium kunmingense]
MSESTRDPQIPAAGTAVPTEPALPADSAASAPASATAPDRKRPRTRTLLIAGGAVLGGLLLAGGGVAAGAAIADAFEDDDDDRAVVGATTSDDDRTGGSAGTAAPDMGTDSAAELSDLIAAAAEVADGDPVAIDAERDGSWDVEFRTSAGDETEVRVSPDGQATVISTDTADDDDKAPQGVLDPATVDALVAAALGETEGRITDLEVDDDATSPYDVTVLTDDARFIDLNLDADFAVLTADVDD